MDVYTHNEKQNDSINDSFWTTHIAVEKVSRKFCAYVMKWNNEMKKACPIQYAVAPNFEAFINKLIVKPTLPSFDFEVFEEILLEGLKECVIHAHKNIGHENISAFGVYTNDEGSMISTSIHTQAVLDEKQQKQHDELYVTSEWKYEGTFDNNTLINLTAKLEDYVCLLSTDRELKKFRNSLIDCCVYALFQLKCSGFFQDILNGVPILMVGTTHGDMPVAKFKQIKKMLNSNGSC